MTIVGSPHRVAFAVLATVVLMAGSCADDGGDTADDGDTTSSSTSTSTSSTSTSTSEPSTSSPDGTSSTTSTPDETSSTTSTPDDTATTTSSSRPPSSTTSIMPPTTPLPESELPGEPFDLTPPAGRALSVIGVAHDDVLHVRLAPGTDNPIVADLGPLADDAIASGRGRQLTRSIWWEITTAEGIVGWVGSRFTAQVGPVFDITSDVIAELGAIPEAETMTELGTIVAESLRPEPDIPSRIVLTVPPSVGDLGEVTYDLVGLGDDTTAARRLHVFGQPLESGEGFSLRSVESTDMCESVRGVSQPEGLCA